MLERYFGPQADRPATFLRGADTPIIGTDAGQWCSDFLAATSVVDNGGELWLYAEGSSGGHEQIGLFTGTVDGEAPRFAPHPANPVLRVGEEGYSRGGVFDPAVVRFGGSWHLYFSATEGDAHEFAEQLAHGAASDQPAGESIGHATSTDGVNWVKDPQPVIPGGRCPAVIVWDETLFLFRVQVKDGGYRIHLSTSRDGVTFVPFSDEPVLDVGAAGEWDARSVTTPKVIADGSLFWLSYAGDDAGFDDLTGLGVAWSEDLVHWTKSPANPIFAAGQDGKFDGVSVQSPIILPTDDGAVLLYAGSDRTVGQGLHSTVGFARLVESAAP